MCGRYYINSNILKKIEQVDDFSGHCGIADGKTAERFRRDIRPSETAPVLVRNEKGSGRHGQKEKCEFRRAEQDEMFLAGFYGEFEGENRFVILTTEANLSVAPVHSRMPLILEREEVKCWILDDSHVRKFLCKVPGGLSRKQEYEQLTLF